MDTKLQCSMVIRGEAIKYVAEFSEDDYGVIFPQSMIVVNDTIHGVVLGCRGRRATFALPVSDFACLQVIEHPVIPEDHPAGNVSWIED